MHSGANIQQIHPGPPRLKWQRGFAGCVSVNNGCLREDVNVKVKV